MKVQGKVILVTGAGGGIGQHLVKGLLERGASVAAADINFNGLEDTKKLAGPVAGKLSLHKTDISSRESVARLAVEILDQHGCIDGIINNAGIIHPFKPVTALDSDLIERVINVNLFGVVNITKTFLPLLLERPVAHIVNVSSMGGLFAFPNQSIYGASKAAVKLISEGLFAELRGTNVGVTVVYPGAIDTEITKNCNAHNEKFDRIRQIYSGTSPQAAALRIIESIETNRFSVFIGVDARILNMLYRISPRFSILLLGRIMKMALSD